MKKSDEAKILKLIHDIGLKNGLSDETVRKIVNSQFEFTQEQLQEINKQINESTDPGIVDEIESVFYYKGLLRLYICPYRAKMLIKRRNSINKINARRNK